MSKSSLLTDLPSELIEHILLDEVIAVEDLCRASQTCKKLHSVAQSNELWKQKLKSRWPELVAKYPTSASPWWQDVYKYRHSCQQRVHSMVEGLSPLHFNDDEISKDGFSEFRALLEESEHSGMTIIDALMDIFRHGSSHENLTMKYYAEKVLRHLQQLRLSREFTEFLDQPPEKQLIELGAVIVAQWCQPTVDITASGICRQLDDIAVRVLKHLQLNQPNHPACCAELYFDRPLSSSLWKPVQCRQVLEAVKHVLYTDMGFRGNYHNYYAPTNSYINMVLELRLGIPISLSIVFSAIARRLGVLCLPVNFPSHFLLKWKEHPTLDGPLQDSYIDVFQSARFLSQNELASALEIPRSALRDETVYDAIPPRLVYERMARNLVHIGRQQGQMGDSLLGMRNALQLYLVISPDDIEKRLLLARLNLHLNINLADVVESLQRVSELDPSQAELAAYMVSAAQAHLQHEKTAHRSKEIKQKKRPDPATNEVAFSIGMIMKHKRYHYVCVIYGWDVRCMASPEWIIQMGVNNLPKKDTQPFYNVLVQDGSNRYAAQENLEFAPNPSEVTHPEVGKYFQEFCKTYYMPNAEKMTQYPEDLALTRSETEKFYQTET